ncbi:MAG: PQQ-binding-like beta-propeller repeat protein, partial [Planctomycetota bacterium JB042]
EHGAEVLSQAAAERTKPRAASLFEAILLLDPGRTDVKKELARLKLRRNRIRAAWIMVGVVTLGAVTWLVVSLFGRMADERLRGRLDAATQLLERGEARLAEAELVELLPRIEDQDDRLAGERMLGQARAKLREKASAERSKRDDTIRKELNEVLDAVEDWRFADAIRLVRRLEEEPTANAQVKALLRTRANGITVGLQDAHDSIATLAAKFDEPDDDSLLDEAMAKYGEAFAAPRLDELRALLGELEGIPEDSVIDDANRLRSLAAACLTVLERVRPSMDSIEHRLARNEALDVLSDDYREIERAETAGEFTRAAEGYDRLLRGYGDGPLRASFEERRDAARRAGDVQADVAAMLDRGAVAEAQEAIRALAAELPDLEIEDRVGFPVRVTTLPAGATLKDATRTLGVAPMIVWPKELDPLVLTIEAPGFRPTDIEVSAASPPERRLDLLREGRFDVELEAPVEVDALPLTGHVLAGGRSGRLLKISLRNGTVTQTVDTGSLMGIAVAPARAGRSILVATGEGNLLAYDADSLAPRGNSKLAEPPIARPWATSSDDFLVATRTGEIHRIDADGRSRRVATVPGPLRAGPVERTGMIAVGRSDGSVVGVTASGQTAYTTPRRSAPVIGLVLAGDLFVAADDSGTLFGLEPSTGRVAWERSLGDASAAAPVASADAVVFAAGRRAFVLDGATGDTRLEVEVEDWASASPTLAGGRLYVTDRSAHLSVFDFSTGTLLFRHRFQDVAEAAALVVPEGVLVLTRDGRAALLGA